MSVKQNLAPSKHPISCKF